MAISEAQKRASAKYVKEKVRQIAVRFYPAEAELWEHLQTQQNKAGYIKSLIRDDLENQKKTGKYWTLD